jgi:hypothetical protein
METTTKEEREQKRIGKINAAKQWKKEMGFDLEPNSEVVRIEGCRGLNEGSANFIMINSKIAMPVNICLTEIERPFDHYDSALYEGIYSRPLCPCCESEKEVDNMAQLVKELVLEGRVKFVLWYDGVNSGTRAGMPMINTRDCNDREKIDYINNVIGGLQQEALMDYMAKGGKEFSCLGVNNNPGITMFTISI